MAEIRGNSLQPFPVPSDFQWMCVGKATEIPDVDQERVVRRMGCLGCSICVVSGSCEVVSRVSRCVFR